MAKGDWEVYDGDSEEPEPEQRELTFQERQQELTELDEMIDILNGVEDIPRLRRAWPS